MEETRNTYTEVLGVLLALGNKYVEKIPSKIMDFLMQNCDFNNIPKIDRNIEIQNQNISEGAKIFLIMLKLKYWCNSEDEKLEIYRILKENENDNNNEFVEQYKLNDIFVKDFEKLQNTTKVEIKNDNANLIKKEKIKWYNKIFSFFKKLFKK